MSISYSKLTIGPQITPTHGISVYYFHWLMFAYKKELNATISCLFGLRAMFLSQVTRDEVKEQNKENQLNGGFEVRIVTPLKRHRATMCKLYVNI